MHIVLYNYRCFLPITMYKFINHLKEGLILTEYESDCILIGDKKINMMPVWLWPFKTKLNSIKNDDKDDDNPC